MSKSTRKEQVMEVIEGTVVRERKQGTSKAVAEALATTGETTVAGLSELTGVSRSAVAKALTELEAQGAASRSEGGRDGGRRLPDRWSPASGSPASSEAPIATAKEPAASSRDRLGKGALGALVLAHLRAHKGEDHGPVAVAKALGGKSSGAVGNALQRLCDSGDAVLVSDSPRRYRVAGGEGAEAQSAKNGRAPSKAGTRRTGAKAGARR
jgi:biotin operon repressor